MINQLISLLNTLVIMEAACKASGKTNVQCTACKQFAAFVTSHNMLEPTSKTQSAIGSVSSVNPSECQLLAASCPVLWISTRQQR